MFFKSGSKYVGGFLKGKLHGIGEFQQFVNGRKILTYEGYFREGQFDGRGIVHY